MLHAISMVNIKRRLVMEIITSVQYHISVTPYMFSMELIFRKSKVHFSAIWKIHSHVTSGISRRATMFTALNIGEYIPGLF